jgi:hypothetical protein
MGNVDIALPNDTTANGAVVPGGIPVPDSSQGSRSVLGQESETCSSLFSLTVLPAYGSRARDSRCNPATPRANKASKGACEKPSKPVGCKRTLTWADVAR